MKKRTERKKSRRERKWKRRELRRWEGGGSLKRKVRVNEKAGKEKKDWKFETEVNRKEGRKEGGGAGRREGEAGGSGKESGWSVIPADSEGR